MIDLHDDLETVIDVARDDLRAFRNARLYLTGGTGFVGTWLLASIVHANARHGLGIGVDVLSRDPAAFAAREPELYAAPGVVLVAGDVRAVYERDVRYDGAIHAAIEVPARFDPLQTYDAIVAGDRAALAAAERSGNIPFLYTSSGAVYGPQPPDRYAMDENFAQGPDPLSPRLAYHHGKRTGELLCAIAASEHRVAAKIARLFAFIGPLLPLDRQFAAGNFIRDALSLQDIEVTGDGTVVRSYLYAADLTAWLWAIFARGTVARAYNVGSELPITIGALAQAVARAAGDAVTVKLGARPAHAGAAAERYVPDTCRARSELGVRPTVALPEALRRTLAFHRKRRASAAAP